MGWTDERVELLSKLWSEGLSASQIAAQLGGVTRNAVIGKVHRLKLEGRARVVGAAAPAVDAINLVTVEIEDAEEPALIVNAGLHMTGTPAPLRSVARMPDAAPLPVEPELEVEVETTGAANFGEVVPISRNLTLVQLSERTCKWPLGDPLSADFRFCGNNSNDASPYCAYHARIAFQPVSERRRMR